MYSSLTLWNKEAADGLSIYEAAGMSLDHGLYQFELATGLVWLSTRTQSRLWLAFVPA